jgi:drug/metabolite transporter (DMT)-like permease
MDTQPKGRVLQADLLLLLGAAIWGFAFAAQRVGMDYIGPFYYNGIRFHLGSLSLLPLIFYRRRKFGFKTDPKTGRPASFKSYLASAALVGFFLTAAASLQQVGLLYTTAGNSGFITGIYVVLVPIMGSFIGRKTGLPTWLGAVLDLAGLFFLSLAAQVFSGTGEPLSINAGDLITLISGLFWAGQILSVDTMVKKLDAIVLCAGQFFVCGIVSLLIAFFSESISWQAVLDCAVPILYGGVCSVGVGYTLQAVAQQYAPPAHTTIIMSLEGAFAALGGVIILHEELGPWTLLGFGLMLAGMLISQWDLIRPRPKR